MTRDEAKRILGEEATEEQITNLLNNFHNVEKAKNEEINDLKSQLGKFSDYDELKAKLDEINQANMTEQQKLEQMKKEAEDNLRNSRIIVNTAKAKDILAGLDLDDDVISMLVSDDSDKTVNNANKLKEKFDSLKETVSKQTKETLMNVNLQPDMSNANPNNDVMTWEKFAKLSQAEQSVFASEHPEEFKNL